MARSVNGERTLLLDGSRLQVIRGAVRQQAISSARMPRMRVTGLVMTAMLTQVGVAEAQVQPEPEACGPIEVREAQIFAPYLLSSDVDSLAFVSAGEHFTVTFSGRGRRHEPAGRFEIPLEPGFIVTRIRHFRYRCDLVLVYEYTDHDVAGGIVTRLDGSSLRPKWSAPRLGFNVVPGPVRAGHLYIAAISTVAKLDLEPGLYVWRDDGLYQEGRFVAFELPVFRGDTVVYREHFTGGEVWLDDRTGRRLRIKY